MLAEVLCDQKTEDNLGEDGLAAVKASLWPRDCQTCGRSLSSQPPALYVNDVREWATAALHHPRCQAPGWNDGSAIVMTEGANTSWTSMSFMLPAAQGRNPDPRPAVLINPSLVQRRRSL